MGSQPCLGRRLPSDWPSWPGLEQGSSSQALQPEPRTVSLPPSALMPFSFQSLLLSLAFLLSPSPPSSLAFTSSPLPWAFLHLAIRSRSDRSPQPTSDPLVPPHPPRVEPLSPVVAFLPRDGGTCLRISLLDPTQKTDTLPGRGGDLLGLLFFWLSLFSCIHLGAVSGAQTCQAGFTSY